MVCYDSAALDVINPNTLAVVRPSPTRKTGRRGGGSDGLRIDLDHRSANGTANLLMLYNPSPKAISSLTSIPVTPAAPERSDFSPPSGRPYLAKQSQLVASRDGSYRRSECASEWPDNGNRDAIRIPAASASVPLARIVTGNSTTLAISDDGTRIMCGLVLYDAATLQVLAQQNVAKRAISDDHRGHFITTQTNQGGAAFSPGGQTLYAAWNIAPPSNTTTTTPGTPRPLRTSRNCC